MSSRLPCAVLPDPALVPLPQVHLACVNVADSAGAPATVSPASDLSELASLVRSWLALSALAPEKERMSARPGRILDVASRFPTLAVPRRDEALLLFVLERLRERVALATEAADTLAHRFTTWQVQWIDNTWQDSAVNPWCGVEVEQYLLRTAQRYRRHPDFDVAWRTGQVGPRVSSRK